ncbi:MAG: saccharopine dehydrogenase NADP-binding domain-containing protein [Anaerolineales bacterium]
MKDRKILIVGGYGGVGRTIARILSDEFPQQIVVAGRSYDKASQFSVELGHSVSPMELDITSEALPTALLDEVALVVMCVDQDETRFVEECIRRGIDYIDITASYDFLSKLEKLDAEAKTHGSTVVLSVGLAPGVTNLLAGYAKSRIEAVEHVDMFILLGLGEEHGEAAVRWTVENLNKEFRIRDAEGPRRVRTFHEGKTTLFPGGLGRRKAYRFDFSDQHVIPRTLSIDSASTWLCFESALVTDSFAILERLKILTLLRFRTIQNFLVSMLRSFHFGSEIFVLRAEAYRRSDVEHPAYECTIMGNGEGRATGIVASKVVSLVYRSTLSSGVFHLEEVVKPGAFLQELEADDMRFISGGLEEVDAP